MVTLRKQNTYYETRKKYLKRYPWLSFLYAARQRCNNPKVPKFHNYGGRGIKCFLTSKQIKYLWFRDKADSMKRPSIDRKNFDGDYTVRNCRFLEWYEHLRLPRRCFTLLWERKYGGKK